MKALAPVLISLFAFPVYASTQPGTVQWAIDKRNSIHRQHQIAFPQNRAQTVGTLTSPTGSTSPVRYNPQKVTPRSLGRGTLQQLARRHPYAIALATAYGAYEYFYDDGTSDWVTGGVYEIPCDPGEVFNPDGGLCGIPAPDESCEIIDFRVRDWAHNQSPSFTELSQVDSYYHSRRTDSDPPANCPTSIGGSFISTSVRFEHDFTTICEQGTTYSSFNLTRIATTHRSTRTASGCELTDEINSITQERTATLRGQISDEPFCPESHPIGLQFFDNGETIGNFCWRYRSMTDPTPISLDDFVDWQTGQPLSNTLYPDFFVDAQTGQPIQDFFDSPSFTDISQQLSDAFESIAAGTAQSTNSSGQNYYNPQLLTDINHALDRFHEGQHFIDPFTGQNVQPDPNVNVDTEVIGSPGGDVIVNVDVSVENEVNMNWDEFPGLTQAQYEESNEKLADAFTDAPLSDIQDIDNQFTDFIENQIGTAEPPEFFDFGLLWTPNTGQCTGFTLTATIRGQTRTIPVDQYCEPYNRYFHPVIFWMTYLLTGWSVFLIARHTVEKTAI